MMRMSKSDSPIGLFLLGLLAVMARSAEGGFYKGPGLFSTRPSETKSLQTIARFGPVGMGIDLLQPAFVMKIHNIEPGSPAEATGQLKAGQIIETINGQKLADIDPRIQLGRIITQAEATDGLIRLVVRDRPDGPARPVTVRIPVLGAYSKTWPLNCPKSDRIVRNFADYLARPGSNKGFGGIGMLFLLSTGDDRDLEPVRQWAHELTRKPAPTYAWHLGYGGIPLCEYYLRTGDQSVRQTIQRWVDSAVQRQYMGGWAGRGGVASVTYGGGNGHLNAGGTAVVTFLMLAKECGADVPDHALLGALEHFFRFAGRGNNPYGNNKPEIGFVDNGKNGNLAFAMAAAASLTPEGENSIYARARDICAMSSFYTTTFMLHGHTGGGIGESWRSPAMGLLYDKKPGHYRQFMDNRMWHYELSRRWDGSFGILGGAGYDKNDWGAAYALTYTIPRKTLRITGAPPGKYAHPYRLPDRPWGTSADDVFVRLEPVADRDGHRPDFSGETLAEDSARPLLERLMKPDVSDQVLRRYACHPDYVIRLFAVRKAMGLNSTYLGRASAGDRIRPALVKEFLASKDPRLRRAALDAIASRLAGEELVRFLGDEGLEQVFDMLADPGESWWVKDAALVLVGRLPADRIVPHVDRLIGYLGHKEWWLQHAALQALAPVVADRRCYRKVLPAIGNMLRTCQVYNATAPVRWGLLPENLRKADAQVQQLARETLKQAYTDFEGSTRAPGGQDITSTYNSQMEFLAMALADVPGGYDVLYDVARQRFPNDPLPYDKIFLSADPLKFGPRLKKAIQPIIRDKLIYEYIGRNRRRLEAEIAATRQAVHLVGAIDGLVDLYRKIGVHEYDWHPFGPDLKNARWDYLTFDPPEKQKYDVSPWRYRKVTYPPGMENWFMPQFDPAQAGWRKGQAPFGQYNGKLVTDAPHCSNPSCCCKDPMRTLWDKEVLLIRGTFRFPPLKPGHLYRIRVGQGQHVGSGSGFRIYINGRLLSEVKTGNGRRTGGRPRGAYITKEFLDQFNQGPVTLAATAFLRYGSRAIVTMPPVPQGIFSLWVEEMKIPPIDDQAIRKSATVIGMLSSQWQLKQDPENRELQSDDDLYHYDGRFVPNPRLLGTWMVVGQVGRIEDFQPQAKPARTRAPFTQITFKDQGLTDQRLWIWSGNMLMDLDRYQALKMTIRHLGGKDYLFVEAGGFSTRNPPGWRSPWYVLERKDR